MYERERNQGVCFGVEISKRNEEIQPVPLDGVERHTYPQGTGAPPCPSTTRLGGSRTRNEDMILPYRQMF